MEAAFAWICGQLSGNAGTATPNWDAQRIGECPVRQKATLLIVRNNLNSTIRRVLMLLGVGSARPKFQPRLSPGLFVTEIASGVSYPRSGDR
jgi:hypothetical protein